MCEKKILCSRKPAFICPVVSEMKEDLLRLAFHLFMNGLRFRCLKWSSRAGRPQSLSLEITRRCIAKCMMCNIWKTPADSPELAAAEWVHFLTSDLFSDLRELDITGGEPFLREDLTKVIEGVSALKRKRLTRLRSIAITTNGLLSQSVVKKVETMLQILGGKGIDLVLVCAMDGIGEVHDRIRNFRNAWVRVDETLQGLRGLREKHPGLIVGIKTTVVPLNVMELDRIVQYADTNDLFAIISPCIITGGRYLNIDRAESLAFGLGDTVTMLRFYRSERFRWSFHAERLAKYLEKGVMRKPCTCGYNYFFVRSTGDVFLCPLINRSIGNVRTALIEELFRSPEASRMRRRIGAYPQCRSCTEPGLERYALPYEGFTYLSLMIRMGTKRFEGLHAHMGLDKYFESAASPP
jgi:MoaA/NifB/PqqE/SkfB family radical SAM enzyme